MKQIAVIHRLEANEEKQEVNVRVFNGEDHIDLTFDKDAFFRSFRDPESVKEGFNVYLNLEVVGGQLVILGICPMAERWSDILKMTGKEFQQEYAVKTKAIIQEVHPQGNLVHMIVYTNRMHTITMEEKDFMKSFRRESHRLEGSKVYLQYKRGKIRVCPVIELWAPVKGIKEEPEGTYDYHNDYV